MKNRSLLLSLLLFSSCATVVMPDGGPTDKEPPQLLETTPQQNSTNFKGKEIKLEFDEYITLGDIQNKVQINPTPVIPPLIEVKGKSVLITLKDSLQPNTTYTFTFREAIIDQKESTPLPELHYTFSTGNYIDTCQLTGSIYNWKTLQAEEKVTIGLYKIWKDSLPYHTKPNYTGITTKSGRFHLSQLPPEKFHLFCWKDANNNKLLDPEEDIAYRNEIISISDSISLPRLYLWENKKVVKGIANIVTLTEKTWKLNTTATGWIKEISSTVPIEWKQDSSNYALYIHNINAADSLQLRIRINQQQTDTINLYRKVPKDSLVKWTVELEYPYLLVKSDRAIHIKNPEKLSLFNTVLEEDQPFTINWEATQQQFRILPKAPEADNQMNITLFKDLIAEPMLDTVKLKINYPDPLKYNSVQFSWDSLYTPAVFVISNNKGYIKKYHSYELQQKGNWKLVHLEAGTYELRVFEDPNQNGLQDAGQLFPFVKEEQLLYLNTTFEIKPGWDYADFPIIWITR